jgi:D-sedoheptulose 7-phosphate isomerase
MSDFARRHLEETARIASLIDPEEIDRLVDALARVRAGGGRLFFLGVGGGAGHASHAVNDFRKLAGFEAYAPTDNVTEITALANDRGWENVFAEWLKESRLRREDGLFVFSVGGGSPDAQISMNLVKGLQYAQTIGATIVGVVGYDGGFTATVANACLIVPSINPQSVTPHTEAFQAVIWHLLVSHPLLKTASPTWESIR